MGAVDEFEALADASKDDGVLADDVAGSDGQQRNLFLGAFADDALATVDGDSIEIAVERLGNRTASANAVPLGASFLNRWCASMISTS